MNAARERLEGSGRSGSVSACPFPIAALAVTVLMLAGCGSRSPLHGSAENRGAGGATGGTAGQAASTGRPGTSSATTGPTGGSTTGGPKPKQRELDKLDILLAVDNSISMSDKQNLLKEAVPDLIGRLANPLCVDAARRAYPALTPPAGESCPQGPNGEALEREFLPVSDVHVGLVTSSLGSSGARNNNDRAHLFGSLPGNEALPGMTAEGFLAWGPETSAEEFEVEVAAMMEAVGETGSGFEETLEAWLKFLIDPAPYNELFFGPCPEGYDAASCIDKYDVDETLLAQRRAFLRPDSVVLIMVLSDEDDCSTSVTPDSWELFDALRPLERPTAACAEDPNDVCCAPCGQAPPECEPDPLCETDPLLNETIERQNLRCFEQKRRFGRDVLYPVERYRNAVLNQQLCPERLDLSMDQGCEAPVANPLFVNFQTGEPAPRTPQAVFVTFIVGVPWHDIAVDPLRLLDPAVEGLVYQSPDELENSGTWQLLIGNTLAPPGDPLMLQSVEVRNGVHPITNEIIAGPEAWPVTNSITGHDREVTLQDDLQYSCTFQLPELRECAGQRPCDCTDPIRGASETNPMCQDPVTGEYSTLQHSGKAYPPQRHVSVARLLGENAVLSSICARNTTDPSRADYAYRPAVSALIERIAPILKQPE